MPNLKDFGFDKEEVAEEAIDQFMKTGFPNPIRRYWMTMQAYNQSVEEHYHWLWEYLYHDMSYVNFKKITDTSTAGEGSSFFGATMQRLGIQQDKVSGYLATIGKMVKEIFQLVREIRILDERLSYYRDSCDPKSKSRISAEITLKGIWIDMVEQGGKNPSSVYGMARELQFVTLPDLFYNTHPMTGKEVDEVVDKLEFNNKVKEVLKRKLRSFLEWKEHTHKEIQNRRTFTIRYLRQHYDIIRMYMTWVRPYLRYISRLMMDDQMLDDPRITGAFESMTIELEYLAYKFPITSDGEKEKLRTQNKKYYSVILVSFFSRTRADMSFHQDNYQHKGPLHVGETEFKLRAYSWTQKEIDNYIKYREAEDLELLSVIDGSVKAAMEALGDELRDYLQEAGQNDDRLLPPKPKQSEINPDEKPPGMFDPFTSLFNGLSSIFSSGDGSGKSRQDKYILKKEEKSAASLAHGDAFTMYKNFKKGHKSFNW